MLAVSVAPLLRRELAHVFTLRTECHPENKCALTLVVRSSGLILAFLNPAGDKHRSPPTRRAIANTARQHGAAVRSTGCTPYTFYTHFGHTRVVHKSEAERWGGGGHKESDRPGGQEQCPPCAHFAWLRDVAQSTCSRVTPPGVSRNDAPLRNIVLEASFEC